MIELIKALTKAQSEFPIIKKNRESYNYDYADLAAIVEATRPICVKNGLCHSFSISPLSIDGGDFLKLTLFHESGDKLESTYPLGDLSKLKDQDAGKTISYGKRYLLKAMLAVEEEKDPADDGWGSEKGKQKSAPPAVNRIQPKPKPQPKNSAPDNGLITQGELAKVWSAACKVEGVTPKVFEQFCIEHFGVKSPREITSAQGELILKDPQMVLGVNK